MGSKLRVHELAKQLGMSNDELLEVLVEEGIEVKSHLSALDEDSMEYILELYNETLDEDDDVSLQYEPEEKVHKVKKKEKKGKQESSEKEVPADVDPDAPGYIDGNEVHFRPPFIVKNLATVLDVKVNQVIMELMQQQLRLAITILIQRRKNVMVTQVLAYQALLKV